MIIRTKNFRGPTGYIPSQNILSDDDKISFVQIDDFGYVFICQSRSGSRQIEIELTASEVEKLTNFLTKKSICL